MKKIYMKAGQHFFLYTANYESVGQTTNSYEICIVPEPVMKEVKGSDGAYDQHENKRTPKAKRHTL